MSVINGSSYSSNQISNNHESYIKKHLNNVVQGQVFGDEQSQFDQPEDISLESHSRHSSNKLSDQQHPDHNPKPIIYQENQAVQKDNQECIQIPEEKEKDQQIKKEIKNERGCYRLDGSDENEQAEEQGQGQVHRPYISQQLREYIELMKKRQRESPPKQKIQIKVQQKIDKQQQGPIFIGSSKPDIFGSFKVPQYQPIEKERGISQIQQDQNQLRQQQPILQQSLIGRSHAFNQRVIISKSDNKMDEQPFNPSHSPEKIRGNQFQPYVQKRLKGNSSSLISQEQLSILSQNIIDQVRIIVREQIKKEREEKNIKDREMLNRIDNSIKESIKIQMGEFQREYNREMRDQTNMLRQIMRITKNSHRRFQNLEKKLGVQPPQYEDE